MLSFLFATQGVLAEGTSVVNITHVDAKNLAAGEKAQISKGIPQMTGDGWNYRYALVYEKAAPTSTPQVTAAPTATSQSGIPPTGDDQTGGLLYADMMVLSAMALIIFLVKGKKWAKGMMVLLLVVCIGGGLQQPAMAAGAFLADVQAKVLFGQEYKYTPPAVEGYEYIGYIVEKEGPQPTATPVPIIGRVIIHHVDILGNELADSLVLTGEAGDSYQSEAEIIKNYTLTATPENAEGVFAEGDIEVVYIYKENPRGRVVINYVDIAGNKVAPSATLSGYVGEKYIVLASEIEHYILVEIPENAVGEFIDGETTVTYVYEKIAKTTVVIKYLDVNGKQLADPVVLRDYVGEAYTSEAKTIRGYILKSVPANANGHFDERDIEVEYIYEEMDKGTVTVKYHDGDSIEVAEPIILTGYVGESYSTKEAASEFYELERVPENAQGKFINGDIEVIYRYKQVKSRIVVNYVDTAGTHIAETVEIIEKIGTEYATEQKTIDGHRFLHVSGETSGIMTAYFKTITYTYEKIIYSKVTVKYVDLYGENIIDPATLTGVVGDDYTTDGMTNQPTYEFVRTEGASTSGKFTKEDQVVIYVYQLKDGKVTVRYVYYYDRRELAPTEILFGKIGSNYVTEAKKVANYAMTNTSGNTSGIFTLEDIEVFYYYSEYPTK